MSKSNGQTLLEKAKASIQIRKRRVDPADYQERLDLALAACRGEVTPGQCGDALGMRSNNALTSMAFVLMQAVRRGDVEMTDKRKSRRS